MPHIPPTPEPIARLETTRLVLEQLQTDLQNGSTSLDTARERVWCAIEALSKVNRELPHLFPR